MWAYKKGYLTSVENALFYMKTFEEKQTCKHIFTLPENNCDIEDIYVSPEGTIFLFCVGYPIQYIYCLKKGHPDSIPKNKTCKKAKMIYISGKATFYQNLTIFKFSTAVEHHRFGSNIIFVSPHHIYVFSCLENKKITQAHLPLLPIEWKNNAAPEKTSLQLMLLTEPIKHSLLTEKYYAFQQGAFLFSLTSNLDMAFIHGGIVIGRHMISATLETNCLFDCVMLCDDKDIDKDPNNKTYISYKQATGAGIRNEGLSIGVFSGHVLKFKKEIDSANENEYIFRYEAFNGKYKFTTKKKMYMEDIYEVPGGLIVLNQFDEFGAWTSKDQKFDLQGNVLIAHFRCWYDRPENYNGALIQYADGQWYYLDLKKQFKIIQYHKSFFEIAFVSVYDNLYLRHEDDDAYDYVTPKYYKVKSIQEGVPIELEKMSCKKILIETLNGFYCFNGHNFIYFHEEINLALKRLNKRQFDQIDLDALTVDPMSPTYAEVLDQMTSLEINQISRNYSPKPSEYHDAIVVLDQNESYLNTVIAARKIHKYHAKLNFALVGAQGQGPVNFIASKIADELFETYFKFDGQFMIPTDNFRSADSDLKFILGWILHNVLCLTKNPIRHHLPLALIAAFAGTTDVKDIELDFYAKNLDPETHSMFKTMDKLSLREEGFESERDWLSMICRYAQTDIAIYEPFVSGFNSFSDHDPIKNANIVSINNFISGPFDVSITKFITMLLDSKNSTQKDFIDKFVERLNIATQSELKMLAFNINGTYHFRENETVSFSTSLSSNANYKFAVCNHSLIISTDVEKESYEILIEQFFKAQQAKMVN
jgi:hypothetical protein